MTETMNIATLMDFPDDEKYNLMCMIWMKRVQRHAPGARVRVLTVGGLPASVQEYFQRFQNVDIRKAERKNIGVYDHFNLSVKLYNLAKLDFPFLFLDADMLVLSDLDYLWRRRNDKPWIGTPIQILPGFHKEEGPSQALPPLNSGLQLVSNPAFYDYDKIVECFIRGGQTLVCAGEDQVLLYDYFRSMGYDYRHPEIGPGWNACSKFVRLFKDPHGEWRGLTRGLPASYPVHIVHYWNGACRPWNLDCPLFEEERRLLEGGGFRTAPKNRICNENSESIRVCVMNASPAILQKPGEHPFYPLKETHVECVENPEAADLIFWHLDPSSPDADYKKLVYRNSAFFKAHEDRFVLFSTARNPGWFYLNQAIGFTPHPVFDRHKNRLSRVISIPHPSIGVEPAYVEEIRREEKRYPVICAASVEPLVRSGLDAKDRSELRVLQGSVDGLREALREIARSRYYVHVESDAASPPWLYEAMRVGAVPVVVDFPDLPFSEAVNWRDFAVFPIVGKTLSQIFQSLEPSYATRRQKAMEFWREYCEPSACNDQLIRRHLSRKNHATI